MIDLLYVRADLEPGTHRVDFPTPQTRGEARALRVLPEEPLSILEVQIAGQLVLKCWGPGMRPCAAPSMLLDRWWELTPPILFAGGSLMTIQVEATEPVQLHAWMKLATNLPPRRTRIERTARPGTAERERVLRDLLRSVAASAEVLGLDEGDEP